MMRKRFFLSVPWLPALCSLMLAAGTARALPVAVNDSYATAEDSVLTVSGGAQIFNSSFTAGSDGMTYGDDPFGTAAANNESGSHQATGGFDGTGGLTVRVGFRPASNGGSRQSSGGWNYTFNSTAAATVQVSGRYRMVTRGGLETNEWGDFIMAVDGVRYGSGGTAPALYVERLPGPNVNNVNNTLTSDTGWKEFTQNVTLNPGSHTLTLGVYNNNSSALQEVVDLYLDDVVIGSGSSAAGVLANDTGLAPLTAVKVTGPSHGGVVLNADGTFVYTPAADYSGPDSFTYRAVDSTGNSPAAAVSILVTPANDIPVSRNDAYSAMEDTLLTVSAAAGVLANDTDPDGDALTAQVRATTPNGTLTLNANGSFTYLPGPDFNGTDSFTYRVSDGTAVSADSTVTITVSAVDDPPVTVADSYRTPVNTALNVSLTSPDGQPSTLETLVAAGSPLPPGDPGEVDLPVWKYLDNGTDQGTAWRNPGFNDAAWASGRAELGYGDGPERTVVSYGPDASNRYPTTYFRTTFNVVDKGSLTALGLELMRDDAAVVYLNGTEIYRDRAANGFPDLPANPAYNAFCSGNISNTDEAALRDLSAYLTANAAQYLVEGLNTLAVEIHQANGSSTDISMDLRLTVRRVPYAGVLYNDTDAEGATLAAQLVTGPARGSLTLNPGGTFLYTPNPGFAGTDSFIYRASDGVTVSAGTTVTLTVVSSGNVPPVAVADAFSVYEDQPYVLPAPGVLANDTDTENAALTAQLVTSPAHGAVVLNADGSFTYTPVLNYAGPDSFTYRARDEANATSPAVTVALTVLAQNDAPVAVGDFYGADPGVVLRIPASQGLLVNDSDVDNAVLTVQLVTGPASGSLALSSNGGFNYTPPAGFTGVRTFTYRAFDGALPSNTVTATIYVTRAPVAAADGPYATLEDVPLAISAPGVLANDSDPEGAALTAQAGMPPAHGSVLLNAAGSFVYTPAPDYSGPDSFTYRASDGSRLSGEVTVSLTVAEVNDPPVAGNDTYTAVPGETFSVSAAQGLLANDRDAEGSPLTPTLLTQAARGVVSLAADGSFSYVPEQGFSGIDTFTYRISDGVQFSSPATVTVNVAQAGGDIVINEIMFRPGGGYPEDTAREYIELYNRGTTAIDLSGWSVNSGVSFVFAPGTVMAPGSFLVVAANRAAFQALYPGVSNVTGDWTGALSNSGERIRLADAAGKNLDEVSYANEGDWAQRVRETVYNGWAWSTLADGGNRSLELRNPRISNDNGQNWSDSSAVGGTPGMANSAASLNIPPVIKAVKHFPAVPQPADRVLISCELNDETPAAGLTASLFWRDATTTEPGAFQSVPMSSDGRGGWFAPLDPKANLTIIEFYIAASDGVNTRTWPAPTSEGQNANCQYQVISEPVSTSNDMYFLTLTAAENAAFIATTGIDNSGNKVDREFNNTLVVVRGGETSIYYRSDMRIRGNSSRDHTIGGVPAPPMRVRIQAGDSLDGSNKFNLNPKAAHLQHLGMRLFQAAGLRAPDTVPVELRRNGVEQNSTTGGTPNFGMWVRMEDVSGEMAGRHWPLADTGGAYKKGRPDQYWRATQTAPAGPDGLIDGFSKQNNSAANDWSDLTGFFAAWQAAAAPHFPGAAANNVAGSGGASTSGNGNWAGTAFNAAQITSLEAVADFDQWARWFAVMTILQDNETNVSNGQDDDYAAYFEPSTVNGTPRRRLQFIPHDLDTIFGLGDSTLTYNARGLYDMTDDGSVFRPLLPLFGNNTTAGNTAFRTKYFSALRELLGTVFDVTDAAAAGQPFNAFVDYHLAGWAPAATRTAIKTFVLNRRAYLLGLIDAAATTPPAGTSQATVTSAHGSLVISEVLAGNVAAHAGGGLFPDVIELRNTGAAAVDLSGMSLTDDPLVKTKYVFPPGVTLEPGAFLILYADEAVLSPGIHTGFGLSADGDAVYLYNTAAAGQGVIDSVIFGLQVPDLSIGRTGAALDTWALCTPSVGGANTPVAALASPAGLRINEWLGNADYRASSDFMELYNSAAQPVAIGGMGLTDDVINFPFRALLPPLSFIGPASWVEFEAKGGGATPGNARELPFGIDATFGSLALVGANGSLVDRADTISQFRDISTGRTPDGTGNPGPLAPPTPGFANGSLPDGALDILNYLRITELMYHPRLSSQSEYIELRNISDLAGTPVELDLSGITFKNGITYTFPAGTTLAPGAFFLLAGDPAKFAAQFPAVPVGGVFTGSNLSNSGERLRMDLAGYGLPILDFTYGDGWYPATDGGGDALQIVNPAASPAMWDKAAGWQASPPSPGSVPSFGVYAGAGILAPAGAPVFLDGVLNPGSFVPSAIALAWTVDSGPGPVAFTTPSWVDANASFSAPGIYVLRLTATAPGPVTATSLVTVTVSETYAPWAARVLAGVPAASRLPGADPDRDGMDNLAEFVLGGDPLNGAVSGIPVPVLDGGRFSFRWERNLLADPDILMVPQLSSDLDTWQQGPAVLETGRTGGPPGREIWTATDTAPPGARPRAYGRVTVIQP